MVMDIIINIKAHMQENAAKRGGGGLFFLFYVGFKIVGFTSTPIHVCLQCTVVLHDCTVIIMHVHVHVSGPVDGSKRHIIFQLISLNF